MNKIIMIFTLLFMTSTGISQDVIDFIDLQGLSQRGKNWDVVYSDINDTAGHIKLKNDNWLMCFLHWRPLTEENKNITPIYVRHQLLNWWGPNMAYFKLGKHEGEIEVNGHTAYYVDGTFNDMVLTRFIFWNCPKTKRQFAADLNINLRMKTPRILHDLQQLITKTIECHGNAGGHGNLVLPERYKSDEFNLAFNLPENWRTNEFTSEKWFPEGLSEQNGTLWTLLTDSEKYIELLWEEKSENVSEDLLRKFISRLVKFAPVPADSSRYFDFKIVDTDNKDGILTGSGTYRLGTSKTQYADFSEEFIFRCKLWEKENNVYMLIASIVNLKEVWGRPVDLRPAQTVVDNFFGLEVLPVIKPFK